MHDNRVELLILANPLSFSAEVLCPLSQFHVDHQFRKSLVTERV